MNTGLSKLCTLGLKPKSIEGFRLLPSPPGAEQRGILYTDQLHNTNQMEAFLKDPNDINICISTVPRRTTGFCLIVCPHLEDISQPGKPLGGGRATFTDCSLFYRMNFTS